MGSVPTEAEILSAARRLIDAGVAVHLLHRRSKRPVGEHWQTAPVHTYETFAAAYRSGMNIGVRPGEPSHTAAGYLHTIDLDIRKPEMAEEAWGAVLKVWPEARDAPFVISGSGGESRHLYLVTDKPFRSLTLAKSEGFDMVFDEEKGREVKKRHWEVSLFGAPKQLVLPPSVHDKTGERYVWGREIEWDLLELGVGPIVPSERIAAWGAADDDLTLDDDDDGLMALARAEPMGLTEAEVDETLRDLPEDWVEDHDLWVQVGMALHHEFGGSQVGFEKWCEWARRSEKFDLKDSKYRWSKSFKETHRRPVRMATLIKAAGDHRLASAHADLDDLIGEPQQQTTALTVVPQADDLLAELLGDIRSPVAPGASVRQQLVYDPEWRSYLHRSDEGQTKPTLHNVKLIVRNDPRMRGIVALNQFSQEIVLIRSPKRSKLQKESPKPLVQLDGDVWKVHDKTNGDVWSDSHDAGLRAVLEAPERQGGYGIKVSQRDMKDAVDLCAQEAAFHPVRDYLNSTSWDGIPRVERLFIDYVGSPDDAYHRQAAMLWLVGAVTRIFEPGHKFDFVPFMRGLQGKRKSTFFQVLAKQWFAELDGDFHDKKAMVEQMQGAWIIEMPELQGFSKAEVTTIKGFISRQRDKVRLSYDRRAKLFARQCVFGGTTNEDEVLRDSTGGRRFWPVDCWVDEIDITRLEANVDQIWAEALVLYRRWREEAGPTAMLPLYIRGEAAQQIARTKQESARQQGVDEVLAARIEDWLSQPIGSDLGLDTLEGEEPQFRTSICLPQIWVEMMGRDIDAYADRDQQLLSRAIRKVEGWAFSGGRPHFKGYGRQREFKKLV